MKIADISIRRPVLATVMIATLTVFGLLSYGRIGVDLFPAIDFPIVTVRAIYPGADPETVETRVSQKLEEAINTVNGIETLRSTSMENVSLVFVQFSLDRDIEQAVQDVRDKVSGALTNLPADLEPPVIEKFDVGAAPIMSLVLAGELPAREMTRLADDVVKDRLQTIPGVGSVDLIGGQGREFHVWLLPRQLEKYGLVASDVVRALAAQNIDIPGGRIDAGDRELMLKTRGQVADAVGLGQIIIRGIGGQAVRVDDVARVEDGEEERRSAAQLNGRSSIGLVVTKQSGGNTVEVARLVREAVTELQSRLPEEVSLTIPIDNSTFIEHAINDVKFDLALGGLLAILIIMVFLHDWRATFISALALPTSVIATFAFISYMGFTFNNMTMLALSLSIGILIDDAIVVIENIHRHLDMGKPAMKAASDASKEIGLAVLATTACIVAVFLPVAVMKGLIGRFFLQFGLTVAFAVSVSFLVAFTLTPMLSARMLKSSHGGDDHRRPNILVRMIEWVITLMERSYRFVIEFALRQKFVTLLLAAGSLYGAVYVAQFVPFEFLPPEDRGQFQVRLEMPPGTSFERTERYLGEVSDALVAMPGVETVFSTVGGGVQQEVTKGTLTVGLVPRHARSFSQLESIEYARKLVSQFSGSNLFVEQIQAVGGGGGFRSAKIQFNLRGNNYDKLNTAAAELTKNMAEAGGYVDVDTTYRGGKPEVGVTIRREEAADLGIPVVGVAMALRTFYAGTKATELSIDGTRYDVRVRLDDAYRGDPKVIADLKLRSASGRLVPLSNVIVPPAEGTGPASIERQNRQRQVTIFANLEGKALGDAVAEIEEWAGALPAEIDSDWAGMGKIMQESVGAMGEALLLAVILIYLILAAQFESFLHPFTIMLSLPLSLVGALGGLALSGMSMNIFSMIGIIMLMGLVTKNAILLVDYTNTLRNAGQDRMSALVDAGVVRLRPILMTTAAMIFGMVPVALALSEGGEQRAPMAVVVIGGLITSTVLTLVVVPVVYALLDALRERVLGVRKTPTSLQTSDQGQGA